jgi:hypothetical protein
VSVQTVDIVNSLPKVEFETGTVSSKEIKLYPEMNDIISIAAEPDNE